MPKETTTKESKGKFHCVLSLSYRVHLQWGSTKRISLKCLWQTLKCSSVVQLPESTEGQVNCLGWAAVVQTQRCSFIFFWKTNVVLNHLWGSWDSSALERWCWWWCTRGLAKSSTNFCPEPEIIRVSHATHWVMPFPTGFCGNRCGKSKYQQRLNYWYYVLKSHCIKPGFLLR